MIPTKKLQRKNNDIVKRLADGDQITLKNGKEEN